MPVGAVVQMLWGDSQLLFDYTWDAYHRRNHRCGTVHLSKSTRVGSLGPRCKPSTLLNWHSITLSSKYVSLYLQISEVLRPHWEVFLCSGQWLIYKFTTGQSTEIISGALSHKWDTYVTCLPGVQRPSGKRELIETVEDQCKTVSSAHDGELIPESTIAVVT